MRFTASLLFFCSLLFLGISSISCSFSFSGHSLSRLVQYQHHAQTLGSATSLSAANSPGVLVTPSHSSCSLISHQFAVFSPSHGLSIDLLSSALECRPTAALIILPNPSESTDSTASTSIRDFSSIESYFLTHSFSTPIFFLPPDQEVTLLVEELAKTHNHQNQDELAAENSVESLQFQISTPGPALDSKLLDSVLAHNLHGSLVAGDSVKRRGKTATASAASDSNTKRPTIAIVASYDSFSIAPSMSSGAHSTGSSAVALLQLIRSLATQFDSLSPRANLLFALNSASRWNYAGDKHFLRNLESRVFESLELVICLDSLLQVDWTQEANDKPAIHVHVSKSDSHPEAAELHSLLRSTASGLSLPLEVHHRKVNLSNADSPFPHEIYARKRIHSITISGYSRDKSGVTLESIHDQWRRGDEALLRQRILFLERLIKQLIKEKGAESEPAVDDNASQLYPGLEDSMSRMLNVTRSVHLFSAQSPLFQQFESVFQHSLTEFKRSSFALDSAQWKFWSDSVQPQLLIYRTKPVTFDLIFAGLVIVYLTAIHLVVKAPKNGAEWKAAFGI